MLWYAGRQFADHIERSGAIAVPFSRSEDFAGGGFERFVSTGTRDGLAVVRDLYRNVLVHQAGPQVMDIEAILASEPVNAMISDTLMLGAGPAAERGRIPWATIGDGPLLWQDPDTPPFGSGLAPLAGPAGRHRNLTVRRAIDRWLFADAHKDYNMLRSRLGLPGADSLQLSGLSPQLHMHGCSPGFEYPRRDLPASIEFVGALGPGPGIAPPIPADLRRQHRTRPLVFVTQGTLRRDLAELALPAARSFSADGYDVLVAVGHGGSARAGAVRAVGERVRVVDTVDYRSALGESDLFVTNGGYTGVTLALAAGVPVLQAGATEEKADIGARLEWAGVGASLRRTRPSVAQLRRAGGRLMRSNERMQASLRMASEMSTLDARTLAPALVGRVMEVRQT